MWEILERDLPATFAHGKLPFYNRQGKGKKFSVDRITYFRKSRLERVITIVRPNIAVALGDTR
jgi:hypothetical protein